jgi:hypothetical protein
MLGIADDGGRPAKIRVLDEGVVDTLRASPSPPMPRIETAIGLYDVWNPGMSGGEHRGDGMKTIQAVNVDHVELGRSLPEVAQ